MDQSRAWQTNSDVRYHEVMDIFLLLFTRLVPLYLIIGLGYLAGKKLHAQKETIAALLIYILAPVVVFDGVIRTELSVSTLSIPIFFFIACCLLCGLFYGISSFFWNDANRNILAFTAGTGNTGYFGIPVTLAIFGTEYLGYTVLAILGFIFYENSLGFFITARGNHSMKESLIKILKLPSLYAFFLALFAQSFHFPITEIYDIAMQQFRGAYSVLGMMLIGLGIASIQTWKFDWLFTAIAFLAKFVAWPLLIFLVIMIDRSSLQWFTPAVHRIMILMAIVPMAANTIAFATHLKAEPEKASVAVLLSTLVALIFIPIVASVFLM